MTSAFPAAPLLMNPTFSPRPWGGTLLASRLGKDVPDGERIGESWELSDHPNGRSSIAEGPFAGQTFGDVLRAHPREMIARENAPDRYPLLVKIIDAAEDLSIQVHPDDAAAEKRGDRGKTECWYVMACEHGTDVIFGVSQEATPDLIRAGARDGSLERLVARHPLAPNDFLFVKAGTVHAILGGTLICEIQQSSDTTYRLWDWNRQPPRQLHVEESLEVIDWNARGQKPHAVPSPGKLNAPTVLTDNEFFRVTALDISASDIGSIPPGTAATGVIAVCVHGSGRIEGPEASVPLKRGETAFIPALIQRDVRLVSDGPGTCRLLLAESREL